VVSCGFCSDLFLKIKYANFVVKSGYHVQLA
jgi:hypothetical protein